MPTPTRPIITESQCDDGTATANDEATGYEAQNLLRNGTKDQWGTANVTGTKSVTIELPTSRSLDFFELYRHNLTISGTIRLRLATSEANLTASPVYDSTALTAWATTDMSVQAFPSFFVSFAAVTASWALIDVSDASNPDGVIRAGRVILAAAFRPTLYAIAGESDFFSGSDFSISEVSPLGYASAVAQEPRLDFQKTIVVNTKTEAERLRTIWSRCGTTGDIAAVHNPVATTLGDMNLGVFRFAEGPRAVWNARAGEEVVHVKLKLNLRAVW